MILSKRTINLVDGLDFKSNQPIIISGPEYLFKYDLARNLATKFLKVDSLDNYPYITTITSEKKSIGIDEIRDMSKFISLSVPIDNDINRIVLIPLSETLTIEAQNALLKNLEESPYGTLFILITKNHEKILPTIKSRSRIIDVVKPSKQEIIEYFKEYDEKDIEQNYILADGAPRLIETLLDDKDSEIRKDIDLAKKIISSDKINRLSYINSIGKTRDESLRIVQIIKQMSKIGILSDNEKQSNQWKNILDLSIETEKKLKANTIVKLTLTDFLINI